jgi:hypothetical protein
MKAPRFVTERGVVTQRSDEAVEIELHNGVRMKWHGSRTDLVEQVEVLLRACVPQAVRPLPGQ